MSIEERERVLLLLLLLLLLLHTTCNISKLLHVISRADKRVKF